MYFISTKNKNLQKLVIYNITLFQVNFLLLAKIFWDKALNVSQMVDELILTFYSNDGLDINGLLTPIEMIHWRVINFFNSHQLMCLRVYKSFGFAWALLSKYDITFKNLVQPFKRCLQSIFTFSKFTCFLNQPHSNKRIQLLI